jgi:acyl-coenzyme A synthetase/AMP-(fatty) acid ligase/acyl carrier protein
MNASFCFDSALERIALVALGYCLHVVSDEVRKSPHALVAYLRDHRIVNVDLVPSHLKVLLNAGLLKNAKDLRVVIVGGEAIDEELWRQLAVSPIAFFNVYGPTENTVNTSMCRITADAAAPHIGKPYPGVECHIVDEELQPCPDGEAGELVVSGMHLALGYYNDPELTARAFVTLDGRRCYRTGDRVKRDDAGNMLFLGRIDDQVKINGYRIELSEVRVHLAALPGVLHAAVTPLKQNSGHSMLATIVWKAEETRHPALDELAALMRLRLPVYMVPQYWQEMDALPLTENLKLDHQALQAHWQEEAHSLAAFPAITLSRDEALVQDAWQTILKKPVAEIDAHFFSSGGDSLAAMELMLELERSTGVKVDLGAVFKYPTIRSMAAWIGSAEEQRVGT